MRKTAMRLLLPLPGVALLFAAAASEGLPPVSAMVVPGIVIVLLILLNGLFVAAEFAIIGVRKTQMETLADEGNNTAGHVLGILQSPQRQDRYIATAQLGITIASLGLGMYGEREFSAFIEPYLARVLGFDPHDALIVSAGYVISLSVLTYLHVVIGEMIPKSLALSSAEQAVLVLDRPMRLMQTVFSLPVAILNGIGRALLRLFRVPAVEGHTRVYSPEELEMIVSESAESGELDSEERELLLNIFDFSERTVDQVMTPRRKVEAVPRDIALDDLLDRVTQSDHSRFPVYDGDLDHVVGILHLKDLVRHQLGRHGRFDIRLLLHPVLVVPESASVEKALSLFRRSKQHMALVADEYGGTAGIVTLEDLVEEIVGEVQDEFDLDQEPFVVLRPGLVDVAGDYLLDDLRREVFLGDDADLPEIETVGGLIVDGLGRPPLVNDVYHHSEQVLITVTAVDGLAVARARIAFPTPGDTSDGDESRTPA